MGYIDTGYFKGNKPRSSIAKKVSKKIVVLGDPAVGKTSLIRRFVINAFDDLDLRIKKGDDISLDEFMDKARVQQIHKRLMAYLLTALCSIHRHYSSN